MQSDVLYDRTTTLPNIRGHFRRARIEKLLSSLLDRHLITVTAGAGWGKTHAVSSFLNNVKARVIWFQLSELDNLTTRFWEEFVYILGFQNKETADELKLLGFPETLAKYDKFLHILAKEIYVREQVVFVFDDFHLIHDESILYFIQNLIFAKLENFCIIINSREKLSFNLTGMLANDLVGQLTAEELYFTPDEIESYLKLQGIELPDWKITKVQEYTKGWPLALYLVGLSIKKGGVVSSDPIAGAIPLIFDMIERDLFSEYTPLVQNFLIRASLLNSFPADIVNVLVDHNFEAIQEFLNSNMFIYYNAYTKYYNFHHLFLEFLTGKQKYLSQAEITDTYVKAAEWCVTNGMYLEAFAYYDKCGHYDEIVNNLLNNRFIGTFPKSLGEFFLNIYAKIPGYLMKKHPILHLDHAGLLLNNAIIQPAIQELLDTQKELEALPLTEDNKYVLGNLYFYLGLLSIASSNYDFKEFFKKSNDYLPNGGHVADSTGRPIITKYAIMLHSPARGELKKMEEAILYAIPYASSTMNGYAYGMEYLASAEAAYFTGDMRKAAKNAFEAVYRARKKDVVDVVSSGYFLLMRIEAINGNYDGVVSHLEQLMKYIDGIEDKYNFIAMPDVAEGWFYLTVGQMEKVASWLVDDSAGAGVLPPYSMGMERLIKAKYLLRQGKYYELLAWLGQSEELFRQNGMWLNLLDMMIYKAVASHLTHNDAQTFAALLEAYEIAHENNLVTQFVEHGGDIRNVIYNVKRYESNTIPETWLNEIYAKSETYEKQLRNLKSRYNQTAGQSVKPLVKITKREMEMLGYLCQGLKNTEIASTCFITVSAVKKMLNNIYKKLGATNRADAVRIALQMELHK